MNDKQKAALSKAIVRFMADRGVEVAVVDSLIDPSTLAVFRSDGAELSADDGQAVVRFIFGWRLFGQFIR